MTKAHCDHCGWDFIITVEHHYGRLAEWFCPHCGQTAKTVQAFKGYSVSVLRRALLALQRELLKLTPTNKTHEKTRPWRG